MTNALKPFHLLVITLAGWLNRQQQAVVDFLIEENRVLRELLEGQRLRFTDEQRMRLAVKAGGLGRRLLDELETLVTPDTLLAWYRKLIAQKWTLPGRDPVGHASRKRSPIWYSLMSRENTSYWDYDRIHGALPNLGHIVAPNTDKNILKRHDIEPAPDRRTTGCLSHLTAVQPMRRFIAVNGLAVCSTNTIGKQLENGRSVYCAIRATNTHYPECAKNIRAYLRINCEESACQYGEYWPLYPHIVRR